MKDRSKDPTTKAASGNQSALSDKKRFAKDEVSRMGSRQKPGGKAEEEKRARDQLRRMGSSNQSSAAQGSTKKPNVLTDKEAFAHEGAKKKIRGMGEKS